MSNILRLKPGEWDLSDLLRNPNLDQINNALERINEKISSFEKTKATLNSNISSSDFVRLIQDSESIAEDLSILTGYAHLKYAENTASNSSAALVTKVSNFATEASNKLLFFDLWFKKVLDEDNAKRLIQNAPIIYRDYLLHERSMSKYTLDESEEKIINLLDVTGMNALIKIYDRMSNSFEFEYIESRGKRKVKKIFTNKEKLVSLVRSTKSSERIAAYKALLTTYKKNSGVLGEIYLNRILNWHNEFIELRKFPTPISVRNLSNDISDEAVSALLKVCRSNSQIFQKILFRKSKDVKSKEIRKVSFVRSFKNSKAKEGSIRYGYENGSRSV